MQTTASKQPREENTHLQCLPLDSSNEPETHRKQGYVMLCLCHVILCCFSECTDTPFVQAHIKSIIPIYFQKLPNYVTLVLLSSYLFVQVNQQTSTLLTATKFKSAV